MKKFYIFALAAMMFAACATDDTQDLQPVEAPETITVGFEGDETRIQLNEAQKTVWTKDDIVSVFYKSDANQKWRYSGETGVRTAQLRCVETGTSTAKTTRVVVVYPYNSAYDFNHETCNIRTQLSATQHYLADSYGDNANIMVSSNEYNQFTLKSVYGWLKLSITGNGEKVRVITFRGNNGEQVAGEAYIYTEDASMSLAADMLIPGNDQYVGGSLVFDDTIITKLSLDCGTGVTLSEEPTAFYIALPPQIYSKGFTVEIKTTDGQKMIQSTDNELIVDRNHIQPMTAFSFANNGDDGLYIPDEALKAYLVNNYDDDCDGEISVAEAEYITMVNCSNKGVADLTGLEACPNLVTLTCSNNSIKAIELPNLTSLKTVTCDGNPIEKLNFDNCIALRNLNLQEVTTNAINEFAVTFDGYSKAETFYFTAKNTPITSFTFKNTTDVHQLEFYGEFVSVDISNNQAITSVDISSLKDLEIFDVQMCKLQSLDVTNNTALTILVCNNNELTALDVSKNTSLVKFYCNDNKLPLIRVNANTLLEEFDISNNLLSTLNVRKNTALKYLCVSNNAELSMVDVQYNTALEVLVASGLAITDIDLTANTVLKVAELFDTNLTVVEKPNTVGLGIVYQRKTPYSRGMMMSITEGTALRWSTSTTTTSATDMDNGANNMATIKRLSSWQAYYPAFAWCYNYGADWYLPAVNELEVIYNNKSTINSTLSANGFTTLNGYYWSSTEYNDYNAYHLRLSGGYSGYSTKNNYTYNVRAVLAF